MCDLLGEGRPVFVVEVDSTGPVGIESEEEHNAAAEGLQIES